MRRAIRAAAGDARARASRSATCSARRGRSSGSRPGIPTPVQDDLAAEARRRFQAPDGRRPADLVVAGNHPWPGDPMQSFKVLLQHRAAGRPGGVLVGFFWTDPAEIDRSFPMRRAAGDRRHRAPSAAGSIRRGLALADRVAVGRCTPPARS